MTHGVPPDYAAQIALAQKLAKARRLELYGVTLRGGQFVGLTRTPERRERAPAAAEGEPPKISRGVQGMLI